MRSEYVRFKLLEVKGFRYFDKISFYVMQVAYD